MYGGLGHRSSDDSVVQPLLDEHTPLRTSRGGGWVLHRVTRFAGAAAIGALVVAAGFIGTDPSHPAVKKFHGIS